MEFNVFITKTVTFWFRNNPPRPAMNRVFFFSPLLVTRPPTGVIQSVVFILLI